VDAIVEAALRKWPNVPHCFGWLALDARGDWYMRDERIQAAGPFPQIKGSRIQHDKLLGFIHRNYAQDASGAAYFQNGPQRVYVELEATPWIWRVQAQGPGRVRVQSHTGLPARVESCWLDELGRLYLACAWVASGLDEGSEGSEGREGREGSESDECEPSRIAFGLVHSLDMLDSAEAIEQGLWQPQACEASGLPERFGYLMRPNPA
jgi:hypothetical protein